MILNIQEVFSRQSAAITLGNTNAGCTVTFKLYNSKSI